MVTVQHASQSSVRVSLRCFSHVRYAVGHDRVELEFAPQSTTNDVEQWVRQKLPESLRQMVFRVAVNREFVDVPRVLCDGDEIAMLPPMQGG